MNVGFQVTLEFSVSQPMRDYLLLTKLIDFFNCGNVQKDGKTKYQFRIRKLEDLENHLFPLMDDYPLQTQKHLDYLAFKQIHSLMLAKQHLNSDGLKLIRGIKKTMNRARMTTSSKNQVENNSSSSWF